MIRSVKRMFEWYLDVPATKPGQDTAWDFSFDWPWPSWVPLWAVLPPLIALALVAIWVYRRDAVTASGRMKFLLIVLRLSTIGLLLLFLTNVTLSVDGTELPVVVVMVDRSASMSLDDHYAADDLSKAEKRLLAQEKSKQWKTPTRLNLSKAILTQKDGRFLRGLQRDHRLHLYEFAGRAVPFAKGEYLSGDEIDRLIPLLKRRIQPRGEQTSFLTAVRRVIDDFDSTRPSAIVLLTDGIATSGAEEKLAQAFKLAASQGVAMYVVLIGSKEPARDLELTGLYAPNVAFLNVPITFSAELNAFGLRDDRIIRVRLHLKGETAVLAETQVPAFTSRESLPVELTFTPGKEGDFEFVVEAIPLQNETNTANNAQSVPVTVRAKKLRVLLADYVPRYEYRYLKHLLEREKTIELETILQDADADYAAEDKSARAGFPKDLQQLSQYDVVILGDLDLDLIPPGVLQNLQEFVLKGKSVMMIAGPFHNPLTYGKTPLETLLPIRLAGAKLPNAKTVLTKDFRPILTPNGTGHPIFRLSNRERENAVIWRTLPKLSWLLEVQEMKPGAVVLAEHPSRSQHPLTERDGTPSTHSLRKLPVVVMHRFGAGKVIFQATDEFWRWRRLVGDLYFGRYWLQAIRYLTPSGSSGKTRSAELETTRKEYTQGETAELTLRFFDPKDVPAANDGVTVVVERLGREARRLKLRRMAKAPGHFQGELPQIAAGVYRAWVEKPVLKSGTPSCTFVVKIPQQEFLNRSLDPAELTEISQQKFGGIFNIANADSIPDQIRPGRKTPLNNPQSVPLWNRWELMLLFALLLLAEWLLRKRLRLI